MLIYVVRVLLYSVLLAVGFIHGIHYNLNDTDVTMSQSQFSVG